MTLFFLRVIVLFGLGRHPLTAFPSGRTDVDIEMMNKDPLLRQLVDDQNWHIWMDDRRSLLSYPVVSDRRQIPVNSCPSLLRLPFPLRLVGGFVILGIIGERWQVCRPMLRP